MLYIHGLKLCCSVATALRLAPSYVRDCTKTISYFIECVQHGVLENFVLEIIQNGRKEKNKIF